MSTEAIRMALQSIPAVAITCDAGGNGCDELIPKWRAVEVAIAALAAPEPKAEAGWRWVPVDPTEAMIAAANRHTWPLPSGQAIRAAIAAAPPQPQPEQKSIARAHADALGFVVRPQDHVTPEWLAGYEACKSALRATLTAQPEQAAQVQPQAGQDWRMRLAGIAAECSDPDTTDALDALLSETNAPSPAAPEPKAEAGYSEDWSDLRVVAENTVTLLEHLTNKNMAARDHVLCMRVLDQAREVLAAQPEQAAQVQAQAAEPLPAKTIQRIKRECDEKGLDLVAFAWAIQRAAAPSPAAPVVPQGMALVPIEPTPAMIEAARDVKRRRLLRAVEDTKAGREPNTMGATMACEEEWAAMLAAAPSQADQPAAQEAGRVGLTDEPSPGLLMSMAIRYDHGLGMPGYYDTWPGQIIATSHAKKLEGTLRVMRQLWEEVTGHGFYTPDKEAEYAALAHLPAAKAEG